jgi:hypothetical protein
MHVRLPIIILLAGAILSAAAVLIWPPHAKVTPPSNYGDQRPGASPTRAALSPAPTLGTPTLPESTSTVNLRVRFRQSRNYAEFVRGLAGAAATGDPIAEYLTARALKYCHENAHWRSQTPGGSLRTRNELELRVGKYPLSLQQEILEAHDRCQGFSQDAIQFDATSAWESWLDKASAAGYPPAQSLKADVSRQAELTRDAANATPGDIVPQTVGPARDLALVAVSSGDPDSIFEMTNWVDGTRHSTDDYGALLGAWGLLACQRGYDDCGPTSQWFRSICSWDVQCADDNSVVDTLRRQFGGRFEDVQNLANAIGLAIDNKDQPAIESYL